MGSFVLLTRRAVGPRRENSEGQVLQVEHNQHRLASGVDAVLGRLRLSAEANAGTGSVLTQMSSSTCKPFALFIVAVPLAQYLVVRRGRGWDKVEEYQRVTH